GRELARASSLLVRLSDPPCLLASDGNFDVGQLYSADEEVVFEAARPILLNGIEVISRPDLGDRAIFLTPAPIGEMQRRPENGLWREFEIARPGCWSTAFAPSVESSLSSFRAWPISPSGPWLANQRCGPRHFRAR